MTRANYHSMFAVVWLGAALGWLHAEHPVYVLIGVALSLAHLYSA